MTVREIVMKSLRNKEMIQDPINREWWIESLEHQIQEYAKQKCSEQRELCDDAHLESLSSFNGEYFKDAVSDAIYESPEPEIK